MNIQKSKTQTPPVPQNYGHGRSAAAARRLAKANRALMHTGQPGQTITMSDRSYVVASDGSFRRVTVV